MGKVVSATSSMWSALFHVHATESFGRTRWTMLSTIVSLAVYT